MKPFSRRQFLRATGASLAALPLMPLFAEELSAAEQMPRRIVFIWTPNGFKDEGWLPGAFKNGSAITDRFTPAANYSLGPVMSALQDFKDRIKIINGMDMSAFFYQNAHLDPDDLTAHDRDSEGQIHNGHDICPMSLTGATIKPISSGKRYTATAESIDQLIADRLQGQTAQRHLYLFADPDKGGDVYRQFVSYRKTGSRVELQRAITDPLSAYDTLFADLDPSGQNTISNKVLERQGAFTVLKDELATLRRKVPQSGRVAMDQHLESLARLESSFQAEISSGCFLPNRQSSPLPDDVPSGMSREQWRQQIRYYKNYFDIITSALACDLTRVAHIGLHNSGDEYHFPFLFDPKDDARSSNFGQIFRYHAAAHVEWPVRDSKYRDMCNDRIQQVETFLLEQVNYFLHQLDARKVGPSGESLLDYTYVVLCNEHAYPDKKAHCRRSLPFAVIGGDAHKFFKPGGFHASYRTSEWISDDSGGFKGRPHNDLMITLAHAMGQTDVTTFGIKELCGGFSSSSPWNSASSPLLEELLLP